MELLDFFERINSPLDEKDTLAKIVEAFAKNPLSDKKIYDNIQKARCPIFKNRGNRNLDDMKKYEEYINQLYLQNHPNERNLSQTEIKKRWQHEQESDTLLFGKTIAFIHVQSRKINGASSNMENLEQIRHRLYININLDYEYGFTTIFTKKCVERNLPYYYKYSLTKRDDVFIIYSDTKHLEDYINILNEIKKEYPHFASTALKPPVLTGEFDNWIGYGVEPSEKKEVIDKDGNIKYKSYSYTEHRIELIKKAILDEIIDTIKMNRNHSIQSHLGKLSFRRYVAKETLNVLFEDEKPFKKKYEGFDFTIDGKEYLKMLRNDKFASYVDSCLDKYIRGEELNEDFTIIDSTGRNHVVKYKHVIEGFSRVMSKFIMNSPNIENRVRNRIKRELSQTNIDPENIFLDKNTIEEIKKYDDKEKKNNIYKKEDSETLEELQQEINKKQQELNLLIEKYNLIAEKNNQKKHIGSL